MFDWTLPTRVERYAFEQLDLNLNRVGALSGVLGCKLDWSIHATYRGSGDLSIRTPRPLAWPHVVVRPWAVVSNRSGLKAVPLLTGMCEVPDESWTPAGVEVSVQLYDRTIILDQWLLEDAYTLPAGTVITQAITDILVALGIEPWRVTGSTRTLQSPQVWLPNDNEPVSWLRVLNDLCDLAGYYSVWADPMGVLVVQPYVAPGNRTAAYRLADDGASNRYLGLKISTGQPIPYNRWVYWSKGREDVEPLDYIATNDDPTHPYSTVNLGRVITRQRIDVEGDVGTLVDRAKAEAMADQRTFATSARFLPVLEHEVVELVNGTSGVNTLASVAGRSLDCTPGALLDLTLRKVG